MLDGVFQSEQHADFRVQIDAHTVEYMVILSFASCHVHEKISSNLKIGKRLKSALKNQLHV